MPDLTEAARREKVAEINSAAAIRDALEAKYGEVYDTDQMTELFTVTSFAAPYVFVTRKSDHERGTLTFQHSPRFYFDFQPNR